MRFQWCLDNPDLVCFLHALRVELIVKLVMSAIVPTSEAHPFQYWVRFEEGPGGNPHAHLLNYAANNPSISGLRHSLQEDAPDPDSAEILRDESFADLARYFEKLSVEWHPAKDEGGEQLYDFIIENLTDPTLGRPQTINLKKVLDETLQCDDPDLTRLKKLLLALIEDGQRHTMHGHRHPEKGKHPCARQVLQLHWYCQWGFRAIM